MIVLLISSTLTLPAQIVEKTEVYDRILERDLIQEVPGGVVLMASGGKIVYQRAFGIADLEDGRPMELEYIFRIGSLTKQFTAVAILQLVSETRLSLYDSLGQLFPDYPEQAKTITVQQLLNHTSGIRNVTELPVWRNEIEKGDISVEKAISHFIKEPLYFPPGSDFHYSNSNYILLGKIIEQKTGLTYAEYLHKNIFIPLGMSASFYDRKELVIPNRLPGYRKSTTGFEHAPYINMDIPFAAGGIMMSILDYWKWHQALKSGKVLSEDLLSKAQSPSSLANKQEIGYGYGWNIGELQGIGSIKHSGYINGFSAFEIYIPKEDAFIAIFTDCSDIWNLENSASLMMAELIGRPFDTLEFQLSSGELESFVGEYQSDIREKRKVVLQNDGLYICQPGGQKTKMIPKSKQNFRLENSLTQIEFLGERHEAFELNDLGIPRLFKSEERTGQLIFFKQDLTDSEIDAFTGTYQFEKGPRFEIVYDGEKIFGAVGSDKKEIVPYDTASFYAKDIDALLKFERDETGKITGFTKIQGGEMKALKIDESIEKQP